MVLTESRPPRRKPLRPHPIQRQLRESPARFKVVEAGRRSGKCLAAGTRVQMADGRVLPVEMVPVGAMVVVVSESGHLEARPVSMSASNGVRDTVEVRTSGRVVTCTPDHPFLVDGEWIEAGQIKAGQLIATPRAVEFFGDEPMDEDELEFLAIWLAEGHGYTVSNGSPEIVSIIERIAERWGLEIRRSGAVDMYLACGGRNGGARQMSRVSEFLRRLGVWKINGQSANSKNKFIPDCVYRLPRQQLARFLNLFVACDGCVHLRGSGQPTVEIGLANERMLRQLAELFQKFGIRGQIRHKRHKACGKDGQPYESWQYQFSEARAVLAFCDEIGALGKGHKVDSARDYASRSAGSSNEYLPVKYAEAVCSLAYQPVTKRGHGNEGDFSDAPRELTAILNSWRKQSPHRISVRRWGALRPWTDGRFAALTDAGLAWEEVKSVEPGPRVETFDLTVEDRHNFIANGLVTHNTEHAKRDGIDAAISAPFTSPGVYDYRVGFCSPTRDQGKQNYWEDVKALIPRHLVLTISETDLMVRLIHGAEVWVVGLDKPARIEGRPWDRIYWDEVADTKQGAWDRHLRPSLSTDGRFGKAWIYGVPRPSMEFKRLADLARDPSEPDFEYFTWKSSDILPAEEIEAARRTMDPLLFAQEYEASRVNLQGLAYYQFSRSYNTCTLGYDRRAPLIFCFDFNVSPGTATALQEFRRETITGWQCEGKQLADVVTCAIGEVWIPQHSNTPMVCRRLIEMFGEHDGPVYGYGDATGGARGTAQTEGSDWDLIDALMSRAFPSQWRNYSARSNPPERARVNAMNSRLCSADGTVGFLADPDRAPHLIDDFEATMVLEGTGGELDKKSDPAATHCTDGVGYYIESEFPVVSRELRVQAL